MPDPADPGNINPIALQNLLKIGAGDIDILVTHEAPYGVSTGYHGQIQGSHSISQLVEQLQPAYHIAGHLSLNLARKYGSTALLCLSDLLYSVKWQPEAKGLQPGCLAILDSGTGALTPVNDSWMADFETPFDFDRWAILL